MQRTVRTLRIVLPIAFAAFVLLIYVSWNREKAPKSGATPAPVQGSRRGDKARLESRGFEDTQTIGGRVVSRIRARRVVAYSSNWNTLEDVQLTIFRANGLTYELSSPQAEFNSQTKEAEAKGGVKVTSSDGITIETAAVRFDGNRLANRVPVKFAIDEWRGSAGALDLDVAGETLRLSQKVKAATQPGNPDGPMTLDADEGTFRRRENDFTFIGKVHMTRSADDFACDRVMGRFAPDRKALSTLEGWGNVAVTLSGNVGPGEDLGGRKHVTSDHFYSEPGTDGKIGAIVFIAESPTPVHAVIEGPPVRDFTARAMRAGFANRAVDEIRAIGGIVMKELGPVTRVITCEKMSVAFDPRIHKASSATLELMTFKDPRTTATSSFANYDITNDNVILTSREGLNPTVTSDGNVIKARQIEFSPKAGTARATGGVIAQLVSKQGGATADNTSVFPTGKPVFVNSDTATMRNATKTAIFNGNVRAWQETNTLFAQEVQAQGAGDLITARGAVRTILYNTDSAGTERKVPVTSKSDQLIARKAENRIELTGNVRIEDDQRTMTAEKSSFFFDAAKKIDRIEADNKVVLNEPATGRKSTGDRAVYQVPRRMVYMYGKPARAVAPNGTLSGESISIDLAKNKVEVLSPGTPTQGTYKPQG